MKQKRPFALKKPKISRYRQSVILLVIGLTLTTFGAVMLWQRYDTTHRTPRALSNIETTTHSTDQPEETKPDCDNYRVATSQPRRIIIDSIGVNGCIVRVGIDQHGAIAVPGNIHLAGWYTNSVLPGEAGLSIIDGHVSGKYNPGIFKKLGTLKAGDVFKIEYGNAATKSFRVASTASYSVEETTKKMYEQSPSITHQLNLITCGGTFDARTQQYEKRILVTASLLKT